MSVTNPSFELAASSGVPGEAEGWTWTTLQAAIEWAEFNSAAAFAAYRRAREDYEAGHQVAWSWDYADETARLAATGFVAADVGGFAIQRSDNTMWVLTSDSPIAWDAVPSVYNESWQAELLQTLISAALFDGSSATLQNTVEQWNVIEEDYDGDTVPDYIGAPWLESETLSRQDSFTLLGGAWTGWKGWIDGPGGGAAYPLGVESFAEYWGTDSLSGAWYAGTFAAGYLRSDALAFPITIEPSRRRLYIYRASTDEVIEMVLTAGEYADAAALASELETQLIVGMSGPTTRWVAWTDGDESGVQLEWKGLHPASDHFYLASSLSRISEDVRDDIGMGAFGPDQARSDLRVPAAAVATVPAGTDSDEIFYADAWSQIEFTTDNDSRLGGNYIVAYGLTPATFDNGVTGVTPGGSEWFLLKPWFGDSAEWNDEFSGGELTAASWTGGSYGGTIESFEDPSTYWPDHIYVDP